MNQRPRIKVPVQSIDIILELTSISIILVMIVYTFINYSELPDTIPTHFNAKGVADDFGSKMTVWLIPGIAIVMYLGLLFLTRIPHYHNYMVNITEDNALENYRLSIRAVRVTNLYCTITFALVALQIIMSAKSEDFNILGIPFFLFIFGVPLIGILFYFYQQKRINN